MGITSPVYDWTWNHSRSDPTRGTRVAQDLVPIPFLIFCPRFATVQVLNRCVHSIFDPYNLRCLWNSDPVYATIPVQCETQPVQVKDTSLGRQSRLLFLSSSGFFPPHIPPHPPAKNKNKASFSSTIRYYFFVCTWTLPTTTTTNKKRFSTGSQRTAKRGGELWSILLFMCNNRAMFGCAQSWRRLTDVQQTGYINIFQEQRSCSSW